MLPRGNHLQPTVRNLSSTPEAHFLILAVIAITLAVAVVVEMVAGTVTASEEVRAGAQVENVV